MSIEIENAANPGLMRRLAAIFYDCWLIAGIWLLGAAVDTALRANIPIVEHGSHLPLQLFLVLSPFGFYGWFWTHGGQTLGMRAWRLRLLDQRGSQITWRQAATRYLAAWLSAVPLGLGYLWIWLDGDSLAWHDRLSGTRLVLVAKP